MLKGSRPLTTKNVPHLLQWTILWLEVALLLAVPRLLAAQNKPHDRASTPTSSVETGLTATRNDFRVRTRVTGPSPFPAGCDQGNPGAAQNINYENAEVESWLVVDPNDAAHLIGIWQQDRWHSGGRHGLMTGVSRDAALTWKRGYAHFSRCAGGNSFNGGDYERASDPWITVSPDGTLYESALAFDFADSRQAILVSRSRDGGDTWSDPATLMFDNNPVIMQDKESITADPHHSSLVYAAWDRDVFTDSSQSVLLTGPTWFSRSTDAGASWEAPRIIYQPPLGIGSIGSEIAVLPDDTLVDFLSVYSETEQALVTIRSTDQGITWSAPALIDYANDIGITDVKTGESVRGGAVNLTADPRTGALYCVWMDARFSGGLRDGIAFSKSFDQGLTWSTPVQINQATNVQAFAPGVVVGTDGVIAVTYYDFRKDTSDPTTLWTNYWRITSDDGGQTWREVGLGRAFDMRTAPQTGLGYMVTDYEGLAPVGSSFNSLFVMTNSGFTLNPTDAVDLFSSPPDTTIDTDRVEVNVFPRTIGEMMRAQYENRPSARRD